MKQEELKDLIRESIAEVISENDAMMFNGVTDPEAVVQGALKAMGHHPEDRKSRAIIMSVVNWAFDNVPEGDEDDDLY